MSRDIYIFYVHPSCVYEYTAAICLARRLDVKQMAKDVLNAYYT